MTPKPSALLDAMIRKAAEYHSACTIFEQEWRKNQPHLAPDDRLDFPLYGGDSPTVKIVWSLHASSKVVAGEITLPEHIFTLQKETAEALAAFEQTLQKK
jgi:hypothetical protein